VERQLRDEGITYARLSWMGGPYLLWRISVPLVFSDEGTSLATLCSV